MANTPARMRSSPTHGSINRIGNAKQTFIASKSTPILNNFHSLKLRMFIEITISRAVDNNTALLSVDRCNRNLIVLKLKNTPMTKRADGTPITLE